MLKLGALATIGAATASLTACGGAASSSTNQLVHGATGGGLKDTLDPHFPVTMPDIARVRNLYEPLFRFTPDYRVEPCLALSAEHNADATEWTFKLREGVTFHDGRPLTANDVKASIERMGDPENPAAYMSDLSPDIDFAASRALDPLTYRLVLKQPNGTLDTLLAQYSLGIIPADFDLAHPIGTGPFKFEQFVPGTRSRFARHDDYWDVKASVDSLVIIDFSDDAAKVNALLAGQVHMIDNLPAYLADTIDTQGAHTLVSETGGWIPFTMRVDAAPFNDVRVRQAMRLIVDRQQMIDQALSGFGRVGNDLYGPFDPDYIGGELPQREQDIDQARALLKAAGQEDLTVELVTSTAVGTGGVEAANLFVQQAAKAGVRVRVNKADPNTFYGSQYLSWVFAQDFWSTRLYLQQAIASSLPTSPYNSTHFGDERFVDLITAAKRTTDAARRRTLLQDAQKIEHEEGGFIIWAFANQVDGYGPGVHGLEPAREQPLSAYRFNTVRLGEQ
ncbi:MAG: ABC transporter substrate-binding protein [Dermatophilus congolensis]|nr:ABC transporter substrate-binding protein [Dermatophilus congolensis]